jgi:hypothetical protein
LRAFERGLRRDDLWRIAERTLDGFVEAERQLARVCGV